MGDHPTVAVITMVRDEREMLPRWIAHYGAQVGVGNLTVFDDQSTDGSTDDLPCPTHHLPGMKPGKTFDARRSHLVSSFARALLESYDVVIYTDVDEFLVPDPARHADLRSYLAARPAVPVIAGLALNVTHLDAIEPPLSPERPVLAQRRFAKFIPGMCKPSIKRTPDRWIRSGHGIQAPYAVDPELFMFHLKFADLDHLRKVGDGRHTGFQLGRGHRKTLWSSSGGDLVARLRQGVAGTTPETVPEFDPGVVDVGSLVVRGDRPGDFHSVLEGQRIAMDRQPLVRIPERFSTSL